MRLQDQYTWFTAGVQDTWHPINVLSTMSLSQTLLFCHTPWKPAVNHCTDLASVYTYIRWSPDCIAQYCITTYHKCWGRPAWEDETGSECTYIAMSWKAATFGHCHCQQEDITRKPEYWEHRQALGLAPGWPVAWSRTKLIWTCCTQVWPGLILASSQYSPCQAGTREEQSCCQKSWRESSRLLAVT